ncbi:hypothetical protein GIS00_25705 [Nakamurella sp. YIM 132087]|uniref:Uncharacterized protein n=1 Tax=Nakamurella alba TaxID=2665158 RepID=A0A7K1FT85_9ACTN|nr:hypothetical protein [Nakamurella alba]MTD17331.1 hypothetical protein [Nakamurella alba]
MIDDPRYHRPWGTQGMAELQPVQCPAGHPLGPRTMLVASSPCWCAGRPHRLWRCWECDAVWVWPGCVNKPEWQVWSGRA